MAGPKQLQNLDVSNRRINSTNVPLEVALLDGSGNQVTSFGGGTQYTEGDVDASITGTALLFEGDSTANTLQTVSSTRPLPVTITGSAGSTSVSIKGILTLDGSTSLVDSTLNAVRITSADVGGSTQVSISSVAGIVAMRPSDTNFASSAGFHFDSSGALTVNAGVGGSTQVAISSGVVQVQPISSSGVSMSTDTDPASTKQGLIVRQVGFVAASTIQTISTGSVRVHQSTASDLNVTVAGYSTTVNISSLAGPVIVRSSAADALMTIYQSTASALQMTATPAGGSTWNTRPLQSSAADLQMTATPAAGSTWTVRAMQSSAADLNVTVSGYSTIAAVSSVGGIVLTQLSDRDASTKVAAVLGAAPDSTSYGLVTRDLSTGPFVVSSIAGLTLVAQNSTTWAVQVDGRVRAQNSTITDFLASVQQNSTVWQVQAHNSTIGDLLASVQQNSTAWVTQAHFMDSSNVTPNIVGTRPTTNAQGLAVRTVLNDLQSTAFSTLGNGSTSSTIVSSAASLRHKVYAYSITSTNQAVNTLTFASSLGNPLWHVALQSFSSGVSGANMAVSPPGWLFATEAASPLVFKITGTTGSYHLSFSYFSEA